MSGIVENQKKVKKMTTENRGSKRKYKAKSLFIPKIVSEHVPDDEPIVVSNNISCCASPSPGGGIFSNRLTFRDFRRGRSLSKSRDIEPVRSSGSTNSSSSSSSSDDAQSLCPETRHKSLSLIDLKSFCSKIHRHLTSTGKIYLRIQKSK